MELIQSVGEHLKTVSMALLQKAREICAQHSVITYKPKIPPFPPFIWNAIVMLGIVSDQVGIAYEPMITVKMEFLDKFIYSSRNQNWGVMEIRVEGRALLGQILL